MIVSTYNDPDALRLVLEALRRQTLRPLDVVIGDDGSTEATRVLIDSMRTDFPVPLAHVWHEDRGFRLAEIRNKSVAAAKGDYIIQIDGDIVVDRHFVEDHARLARKGFFVKGTRIKLSEKISRRLRSRGSLPRFMPGFFSPGIEKQRFKTLRLTWPGFRKSLTYRSSGTGIGANMAFWRSDFLKTNGYDESFTGWGCEDTDLMERFLRMGLRTSKTFHVAKAYHLYHPENPSPHLEEAYRLLAEKAARGETECENGISKWLNQK